MAQSVLIAHLIYLIDGNGKRIDILESFYLKVMANEVSLEELIRFEKSATIHTFKEELRELSERLKKESRTAKLWFLYIDYINVVKEFICAERISDWNLHLQATGKMMNLLLCCDIPCELRKKCKNVPSEDDSLSRYSSLSVSTI
jgi:hypothetical protein